MKQAVNTRMARSSLTGRDFRGLMDLFRRTYAVSDLDSFRNEVVLGLQKLVPSVVTAFNEVDLRAKHNRVIYDQPEVVKIRDAEHIFDRHISEHPLIAYSQSNPGHSPVQISDLMSTTQFHRLGLYNEFFRLIGVEDQMAISLPSARPLVVGIVLNREKRNFTERERLMMKFAYPHLAQAYQNLRDVTRLKRRLSLAERVLTESRIGVILLNSSRRVRRVGLQSRILLAKYLPGRLLSGDGLPELLQGWTDREMARFEGGVDVPPRGPLVLRRDSDSLIVRLFRENGETGLLLEELQGPPEAPGSGYLTKREREILHWVSRGKTNLEIAFMLDISPRTVQKHLEHIFNKLGVETRTAAVAKSIGMLETRYLDVDA